VFRYVIFIVFSVVLLFAGFAEAQEGSGAAFAPEYITQANKYTQRFLDAADQMKATQPEEWSPDLQKFYLANAIWAVYSAAVAYNLMHDDSPTSLQDLYNDGLLAAWPENPYNEWQPMDIKTTSVNSPGDFYLQYCPARYYSSNADGTRLVPLSFVLAVFAPDQTFANQYADITSLSGDNENSQWMIIPTSAIYALDFYSSPESINLNGGGE
jgi:hypothetical protein